VDSQLLRGDLHWDDDETSVRSERVMPAGEETRRRLGISHEEALGGAGTESDSADLVEGQVTEVAGRTCLVAVGPETRMCQLRGKLRELSVSQRSIVTVGDRVRVRVTGEGDGVIDEVLPRRNGIARKSLGRDYVAHVVAANVDRMVIVGSVGVPALCPGLIDRYLVIAVREGMNPIICINKGDLDGDGAGLKCALEYRQLGYDAIRASAETGEGLDGLRDWLVGRTSVFVGESGVGKSSLLNGLDAGLDLATGEVSQATKRGRHITTRARLLRLSFGGWVVDTPGVCSLDPFQLERGDVVRGFCEIGALGTACRFDDCRHVQEPGCAVREALASGSVLERRYMSYLSVLRELGDRDR
jgi:ribosome biogenesis GTPase